MFAKYERRQDPCVLIFPSFEIVSTQLGHNIWLHFISRVIQKSNVFFLNIACVRFDACVKC